MQYQNLIFRAMEDKSANFYKENGLPHNISFRNFDNRKKSDGYQTYAYRSTIINKSGVGNLVMMFETIFHENQHAVQNKEIMNAENMNFLIYDMRKMFIMRAIEGEEFQEQNYWYSELEVDARIAGNIKNAEYLQKIGINTKDIVDSLQQSLCSPERTDIIEDIDTEALKYISEQGYKLQLDATRLRNKKRNFREHQAIYGDAIDANIAFQYEIEDGPDILDEFPTLKMEFYKSVDKDGNECVVRKGNIQILSDYNDFCISDNLQDSEIVRSEFSTTNPDEAVYYQKGKDSAGLEKAKLYAHILNGESMISPAEVMKDIILLPKLDLKNPKLMNLMDNIIVAEIIPGIDEVANLVNKADTSEQRKEQIVQSITAIEQFLRANPDYKYAGELQKKLDVLCHNVEKKYGLEFKGERKSGEEELKSMEAIANEVPGLQVAEAKKYVKLMIDKEKNNNELSKTNESQDMQNR